MAASVPFTGPARVPCEFSPCVYRAPAERALRSGSTGYGPLARAFNVASAVLVRASHRAAAILLATTLLHAPAMGQEDGADGGAPDTSVPAEIRILAFGASIVQGYGLPPGAGLTAQLEAALRAQGYDARVVNAGVSGDTTAGGLARLEWTLAEEHDIAILALGSNDGLRGIDPADTRANLDQMLTILKQHDLPVLLVGMYAPRNLGADYVAEFDAVYPALAEAHDVPAFMPFLLEGVATDLSLNQADGIHPNEAGVAIIVERMMEHLVPLLDAQGFIPDPEDAAIESGSDSASTGAGTTDSGAASPDGTDTGATGTNAMRAGASD